MDKNNKEFKALYKCIMANISAIRQQTAYTTYQLLFLVCSTRATHKKSYISYRKILEFSVTKVLRMGL